MTDRFLVVFAKKIAPSKGYVGYTVYPTPFATKIDARKFILKVLKTKKQFFSATIYTTGEIGDKGQYLHTEFETFSTKREGIKSVTVKGKKMYYISDTFRNPTIEDRIVNDDGRLSHVKINTWIATRDPHYWDIDFDTDKIKRLLRE